MIGVCIVSVAWRDTHWHFMKSDDNQSESSIEPVLENQALARVQHRSRRVTSEASRHPARTIESLYWHDTIPSFQLATIKTSLVHFLRMPTTCYPSINTAAARVLSRSMKTHGHLPCVLVIAIRLTRSAATTLAQTFFSRRLWHLTSWPFPPLTQVSNTFVIYCLKKNHWTREKWKDNYP